ncbi:hypothetical protein F0562_004084 [Nyssa sinensis]|uniref:HMA domain-containing protein n=1 Tax=Nyssa sinensis TaxID=561372 RepID=A0A5J5BX84_9ASTE|nr:hypothetical protein F0562_004084 [Nyssa sinensis]
MDKVAAVVAKARSRRCSQQCWWTRRPVFHCAKTLALSGVYSVTIDGKEGTVKVTGEVDPSVLMRALAKTGKHAELVWVKLTSSAKTRGYANNKYGSYGYAALPQPHPSLQHYPPRRPHIEYPWYNTNYH